ncbi:MAG TPA: caspase family protein [Anaerolineales bacterium]|nr:caspase family protein [Anaerolineales bacterium]
MKYALIIGNNQYDDPKLAQLKTPAADSQALAKVLADKSIGSFDEVTPLINKNESEIRRAISAFLTNKKPDDLVLVYFSGHGVLDDRGRLFLSLKDTETTLLKATAIPSTFISDEMDSCRSRRQILILDCCHSGAFARGTKGEQKAVTEATFEGSGYGRVVMTASDSTQYALEGDQVIRQTDLSLFTHFLLEGLKTGEADTDHDGHISLDEWYDYTYAKVVSETPRQIPHRWSYNQQGDLIIARNPNIHKRVVELPFELAQAVESSFTSIRENAVHELGRLLRSRDAELANLARLSLEKMKGDDSRRISSAAEKLLAEFNQMHAPAEKSAPVKVTVEKVNAANDDSAWQEASAVESSIVEKANTPLGVSQSSVPENSFWPKWSATIIPAIMFSTIFYFYNLPTDLTTPTFVGLFMAVTGSSSAIQWFAFREKLKYSWIAGNLAAGLGLGVFHIYLYAQTSEWWGAHLSLLLALWVLGDFVFGSMLITGAQQDAGSLTDTGAQHNFIHLLAISLIVSSLSSLTIVLYLDNFIKILLTLYGILAIITGIFFFLKKDVARTFGFSVLAVNLVLDGINVERFLYDSSFQNYFFSINGLIAITAGILFASQKETRRNFGLIMLSIYLFLTGLSGVTTYQSDVSLNFLAVSILFSVPAAIFFLVRR